LLNNGMILRVGALSNGRVNRPWVAHLEWASSVELTSCQFHAYVRAVRMPTLLLFIPKFSNAKISDQHMLITYLIWRELP
ncbi:hypothetical protein NP568_24280, partial [Vibrio parahaemolyticus]|nr:hypothetical protein [Vibrio parahaemolyticus]